jgi:FkbM family methyltransferase
VTEPRPRTIAYLGDGVSLTTTQLGHKIFVDTRDTISAPHLLLTGGWEVYIAKFLRAAVQDLPRASFVDIGAHLGWYTLLAHHLLGERGTVYSFEPNPRVRELLERTLHINGLARRTHVYPYALSDHEEGTAALELPKHWSSNARLVPAETGRGPVLEGHGRPTTYQQVPVRKLDTVLHGLGPVDFVKIDAEGAECRILRGAERTLDVNPQIQLLVEHHDHGLDDEQRTMEWLVAKGFGLAVVDHDSLLRELSIDDLAKLPDSEMLYLRRP